LPYMMWLMQRPTTPTAALDHPDAWMQIEIVSPWRARGVPRFIAAAEVACTEFFNPVSPEELADRLRAGPGADETVHVDEQLHGHLREHADLAAGSDLAITAVLMYTVDESATVLLTIGQTGSSWNSTVRATPTWSGWSWRM
jgi:hypothetical protein